MLINEAQSLNLTRKHFTLIAEIIGQVDDKGNREGTAQAYAILFEQTHPRFDRAKFEAYVEEVHADCWSDNGPIYEKGVWITYPLTIDPISVILFLMMNDDKAAIQEQILDAAEAVSHLTIRAEQDAEREEQYNIACEGDDYFDYMMDKRFDR